MANFKKFGKTSIGHLAAHFERWKIKDPETGKEEYIKFGNQDIDITRTHLNYNLGPEREMGQVGFIQQRLSEVRVLNREDVKVLCSWVVTLPTTNDANEEMNYSDAETKDFFKASFDFLADRYGMENVVSAYVHMDETTPHMHYAFIPVVEDQKRGDMKVSAKEAVNRTDLRTFHIDLQRELDDKFGVGFFPVLNGKTDGGNLTISQLKAERAAGELEDIQEALMFSREELANNQEISKVYQIEAETAIADRDAAIAEKEEARRSASEVSQKAKQLMEATNIVKERKEALEGRVEALEAKIEAKQQELDKTEQAVDEAKTELSALDGAIKKKKAEGQGLFGSHEEMARAIQREREAQAKEKRQSLIEKFLELPGIKPLWEKFVLDHARGKSKAKRRSEPEQVK